MSNFCVIKDFTKVNYIFSLVLWKWIKYRIVCKISPDNNKYMQNVHKHLVLEWWNKKLLKFHPDTNYLGKHVRGWGFGSLLLQSLICIQLSLGRSSTSCSFLSASLLVCVFLFLLSTFRKSSTSLELKGLSNHLPYFESVISDRKFCLKETI